MILWRLKATVNNIKSTSVILYLFVPFYFFLLLKVLQIILFPLNTYIFYKSSNKDYKYKITCTVIWNFILRCFKFYDWLQSLIYLENEGLLVKCISVLKGCIYTFMTDCKSLKKNTNTAVKQQTVVVCKHLQYSQCPSECHKSFSSGFQCLCTLLI